MEEARDLSKDELDREEEDEEMVEAEAVTQKPSQVKRKDYVSH